MCTPDEMFDAVLDALSVHQIRTFRSKFMSSIEQTEQNQLRALQELLCSCQCSGSHERHEILGLVQDIVDDDEDFAHLIPLACDFTRDLIRTVGTELDLSCWRAISNISFLLVSRALRCGDREDMFNGTWLFVKAMDSRYYDCPLAGEMIAWMEALKRDTKTTIGNPAISTAVYFDKILDLASRKCGFSQSDQVVKDTLEFLKQHDIHAAHKFHF
jgi:hypothetical protein